MSVIDDFLEQVAKPERTELERIRKIVKQTVPDAKEVISYAIPVLKYKGKYLIGFAAYKNHLSLFPGAAPIEALQIKLQAYKLSRGTIQFTLDKPLSEVLIKEIVAQSLRAASKR